jgi:glycosyltransferase involved in cell wall biosynthesis
MNFEIVTASHSDAILEANLRRSPLFARVPLHVERNAPSAGIAYNRGLDATTAPYIVFAHHDVFLPAGWDRLLSARIAELDATDPQWALIGTFGVGLDGGHIGPVWSSSLGQIVGRVPMAPAQVQSFDELLIVMRRDAGLRWDDALPGWHMYGSDIVATARAAGRTAYAGALPCIHNDGFHESLGPDYTACYRYMQRKWAGQLPLRTPITKISRSGLHLWRDMRAARKSAVFRAGMAIGTGHPPESLASRCGWADLTAST